MLKLIITFLFLPIITFSQPENSPEIIWKKCVELYRLGKLDSIHAPIRQPESVFSLDNMKLFYVYTDTLQEIGGNYSIGCLIIDYTLEFEALKIGEWTTYYPNGKLHSKGNYGIGIYTICRGQAPSLNGYSFKENIWTYWYQNGTVMASGKFSLIPTHTKGAFGIRTIIISDINDGWQFYNSSGQKLKTHNKIIDRINKGG